MPGEVEVAMLTATFDAVAGSEEPLAAALAHYVVMTRGVEGCRNVDLVMSATHGGRFLVIAHAVLPLLGGKPEIDLYDTISAHDLA